jgi:diguanylate cyclase (GGDEF)-like protein/PAS domain S-box-containing protein
MTSKAPDLDFGNEHAVPVSEIATRSVATLPPEGRLGEAAAIMAERRISSILIADAAGHPLGIITERNIVQAMQAMRTPDTPLAEVMSSPIISVPARMAYQEAYLLCLREGIRHLAVVDDAGLLAGVASETDFRLRMNLTALAGQRLVTSVMTRTVLSLPPDASLLAAVALMEGHRENCAVVVEDDRPVGIVTERDVVRLYSRQAGSAMPCLAEVMAAPVLTVPTDTTVNAAAGLMLEARVRNLVVVDPDGALAGLISEHDLTQTMALGLIEARLDAERTFLRGLVANIPDLVWLKDPNGVYLACNRRFERFFGAREAEIAGKTDYDFVDREQAEAFRANDRLAIANGGHHINEERIRFADDGHEELLETIKTPMRDAAGRLIGVLGIGRDITAARQAQEALKESEEKLRTLIEAIPDPVQFKDAQGRWLAYNRSAARNFGLDAVDCLGRSDGELAELAEPFYRPLLLRCYATDQAVLRDGATTRAEQAFPQPGGDTFYFDVTKVPLIDADGRAKGLVILARDITERKKSEESLRLAASVFTGTHEGIVITDASARIVEINEAFTRITGYPREAVLGKTPAMLKSGHQDEDFYRVMWHTLTSLGHWSGEVWNRRRDGVVYAEHLTISAVRNDQGEVSHYVGVFADITAFKEHEQRLERIAHYDALTGVPNRVLLADRMAQAAAQSQRNRTLMAVCYLDLDGFKPVNDSLGHEAGDQVLVEMARRMKECLRGGDTIARMGGDEFVLLLVGLRRIDECEAALERVLAAIARPVDLGEHRVSLSASLGVTLFPDDDADADTLLRHADQAMYQAKESGKNRFHLFDPEQQRQVRAHRQQQERLAEALAQGEFELHYQPKVDMGSGEVLAVEALIRWQHPERGLLLPDQFLHDLEGSDLEVAVGEWVLDTALGRVEAWRAAGMALGLSVNIGAHHLLQPAFADRLGAILRRHPGVPRHGLELEILESTAITDSQQAALTLGSCRALGVRFALDDFGTGCSSLTYFRRLPVETLKIDRSFVSRMLEDPEDLGVVESVIQLARAFNRSVVAEGAETAQHCGVLTRLGCRVGQGYGIARPMPADQLPGWLVQWRAQRKWQEYAAAGAPDKRADLILTTAIESHRKWVDAVAAYLGTPGQAELPPLHAHQCRFGHWYHGNGSVRYGHLAEFAGLDPLHLAIHALAKELTLLAEQGRREEAVARLPELHALRDRFVAALEHLIEVVGSE